MEITEIEQVTELMDGLSRNMSPSEYREFLDEIASNVETRLDCLNDEEAAGDVGDAA